MGLPALDRELEKLKAQLADLSAHYTDRHPDVRKLKEQIAKTEKMKQDLAASPDEKDSQASDTEVAAPQDTANIREITPTAELESQLKVNKLEVVNRQRAIQELQNRIDEYQVRLNRAPAREEELAALTRGYNQSQDNYNSLLKKKNDSELATSLERRQQGEHFRVLDAASLPIKPCFPDRPKLCLIGLLVGIMLGCSAVAGAEMLDERLRSEKELKDLVPVEIIAHISDIDTPEEQLVQQKLTWLSSAAAVFVLASIVLGYVISYLHG
jgi:uncharacterized protein involved in exopolysaccharide biosynthesis